MLDNTKIQKIIYLSVSKEYDFFYISSSFSKIGDIAASTQNLGIIEGSIGRGWLNLNPASVNILIEPGLGNTSKICITASAIEGLISQNTASKAIDRLESTLKEFYGSKVNITCNDIENSTNYKNELKEEYNKNIINTNSKYLKYILIIIAFVILVMNIGNIKTLFFSSNTDKNDNNYEISHNEPAFEVNKEFLQAYLSGNKIAADEKYKDKRFIVRGMVSEITNVYEPIIKVETEVGAVDCVFDKSKTSELAKLSIAQKVEIDCVFKGILISARFENCKITKSIPAY